VKGPVPLGKVWGKEILEKFATLVERNYFLPLGYLTSGLYRMEIELEKDVRVTVHLISEEFEWVVEEGHQSINRLVSIRFIVEEPGNHYFRMYPETPVRIDRLAITKVERRNVTSEKEH